MSPLLGPHTTIIRKDYPMNVNLNNIPFVQAYQYGQGGNGGVTRIVVHDEESPDTESSARDVANYFASGPHYSANYTVDDHEIVQCVHLGDTAYHAPPNGGSVGIEHAGFSSEARGDWLNDYNTRMLRDVSAPLMAALLKNFGLPNRFLSPSDLLNGGHGWTTHNNVSLAWHQSDHTDPGPGFPIDVYTGWINDALGASSGPGGPTSSSGGGTAGPTVREIPLHVLVTQMVQVKQGTAQSDCNPGLFLNDLLRINGFKAPASHTIDGATVAAYQAAQQKQGFTGTDADGIPGPTSLDALIANPAAKAKGYVRTA